MIDGPLIIATCDNGCGKKQTFSYYPDHNFDEFGAIPQVVLEAGWKKVKTDSFANKCFCPACAKSTG